MNTFITTVCNSFWRNEIGRNHKTLIGGVHINLVRPYHQRPYIEK